MVYKPFVACFNVIKFTFTLQGYPHDHAYITTYGEIFVSQNDELSSNVSFIVAVKRYKRFYYQFRMLLFSKLECGYTNILGISTNDIR